MNQVPSSLDHLALLRKEYTTRGLNKEDLATNPYKQFEQWFHEAEKAGLWEPNAMSLGTSDPEGRVTLRTVLLKGFDTQGFIFFTNYTSDKAQQIAQNPQVSLLFPWVPLERQVSITGLATKITPEESHNYFFQRPWGSQLSAWVSHQSQVIASRRLLEEKFVQLQRKFPEGSVPFPDFWGGYRVVPLTIEFWQGAANRLHDRFRYTSQEDQTWHIERLSP